jgi:hypothetical protein
MRTFAVLALLVPGCMGFTGGVIPDTGPDDDLEPDDSGPPDDSDSPEQPGWVGSGADGALQVDARFEIDSETREGREHPDAVHYGVVAISEATITLDEPAEGLLAGDEALIINLRGSAAAYSAVGSWALVQIEAVDGVVVQLEAALTVSFGEASNEDLEGQVVVIQRVPQYTSVTVADGGTLTTSTWNRSGGGVLALRAREGIAVQAGGEVDTSALGYAGGDTGSAGCDGYQGESITGWGLGGACGGGYNGDIGAEVANVGGGGCLITGGGGGYGNWGHPGEMWNTGYQPPSGGEVYGDEALERLHLGSGGGGVWNGSDGTEGPGGAGGGILLLSAASITVAEGGTIRATGGDTHAWSTGSYSYGAGGGAGGSVWLIAGDLELAEGSVLATGGAGEDAYERYGGDGGDGRVRVDCQVCNGAEPGSVAAAEALATSSDPDPGWSEAPS